MHLEKLSDAEVRERLEEKRTLYNNLYWERLTLRVLEEDVPEEMESALDKAQDDMLELLDEQLRRHPPSNRKSNPLSRKTRGSMPRKPAPVDQKMVGRWVSVGWETKPSTIALVLRVVQKSKTCHVVAWGKGKTTLDIIRFSQCRGFSTAPAEMYCPVNTRMS